MGYVHSKMDERTGVTADFAGQTALVTGGASPPSPVDAHTAQPQHSESDHSTRKRHRMPTTASEKLTPKGRATRGRIVAAAAELMSQRGVAGTTIEDIQDAAAVSTSQMYHYFADKGDLVAAVIDFQTDQVLGVQHLGLDRLECLDDLHRWRDIMVDMMRSLGCVGGCPIGSLANELSEIDPLARARLMRSFAQWEKMIHDGLMVIAGRGQLAGGTDIEQVALAMLTAVQGGLLLSEVRRDTAPLEAAIDTMIDYLRKLGVR
jgi:TetR/AcrR family transcriptional regulator, transcriptional repressor for nem operon